MSGAGASQKIGMKAGILCAAAVGVIDQATKYVILEHVMSPPRIIEVTPFFNLVLAWNRGVSFGMFGHESDLGPILLTLLALAISAALLVWMYRAEDRLTVVALGLIVGGAIGNVIDRIRFGAVTDFLDFHAFGYHWPAFNAADSAICIGAAILIGSSLFRREEKA